MCFHFVLLDSETPFRGEDVPLGDQRAQTEQVPQEVAIRCWELVVDLRHPGVGLDGVLAGEGGVFWSDPLPAETVLLPSRFL